MGRGFRVSASIAMAIAIVAMQIPSHVAPLAKQIPAVAAATILPSTAPNLALSIGFDTHTPVVTTASQVLSFSWPVRNEGTAAWTGDNVVNLSVCVQSPVTRSTFKIDCDQPSPNAAWNNDVWASPTRYASQPSAVVAPGATATYDWSVRVPSDPNAGEYTFLATFVETGTGARSQTFKQMVRVPGGSVFTVNSNADTDICDGPCTLRGAINQANNFVGTDTIVFNLEGSIAPASPLPAITDAVVIDGTTEPGYIDHPVVELNGAAAGPGSVGLRLSSGSGGSTIRGLAINRFKGWGIDATAGSVGLIAGNFIGTDLTGTTAQGNGTASEPTATGGGIRLLTGGSVGYDIGTLALGDGNLVSGNIGQGVEIGSADAPATSVRSNVIGAAFGGAALPNGENGLFVRSPSAFVQDNVIVNNNRAGIRTESGSGTYWDNVIRSNGFSGVSVGSAGNTFDRNDISLNGGPGVLLGRSNFSVINNVFTDNVVHNNTVRGFELFGQVGGPGVTEHTHGSKTIRLIADRLGISHVRTDLADDTVRFWPVFSYLIVCRSDTSPVQIVRVLHGKRDVRLLMEE